MEGKIDLLIAELEDLYHLSKIKALTSKVCADIDLFDFYLKYDAKVAKDLEEIAKDLVFNGYMLSYNENRINNYMTTCNYKGVIAILKTCKDQL